MRAFVLIEIAVYALLAVALFTQIVYPGLTGRPFFPLLRTNVKTADQDLTTAQEGVDVARAQKEAKRLRSEAKKAN